MIVVKERFVKLPVRPVKGFNDGQQAVQAKNKNSNARAIANR